MFHVIFRKATAVKIQIYIKSIKIEDIKIKTQKNQIHLAIQCK